MLTAQPRGTLNIYRADHIGSFLRPPTLLEARSDPTMSAEPIQAIEDDAILRALAKQKELGFKIFTDGELRRATFMSDFNAAIEGFDTSPALHDQWSSSAARNVGVAVARVRARNRMCAAQLSFMKAHSPGDIKMTLPSANQFPALSYKKGISDVVYSSYSEFLWDCAAVIRDEVTALAQEGVSYLQLDAPRYSYYIDPKWREYVRTQMEKEPDEALTEAIRVDNLAFDSAKDSDLTLCIHLCRGNNRSQWYAEGGYDAIAEELFNELHVDTFSLEYDTARAGTFEPLRFVPPGKCVILGLISTKVGDLESADHIAHRIDDAAKYVPLDRLSLSPQCGFASVSEGNLLSEEQQWRKMALVTEVARRVWGTT